MRNPGVPIFGQKKNFRYGFGTGRVRYGAKPKRRRFRLKTEALFSFSATPITAGKLGSLSSALCLLLPPPLVLGSLSSALCLSLPPPPVSSDLSPLLSVSHFLRWSSALYLSVPSISQYKLFCFYYLTLHVVTSPYLMVLNFFFSQLNYQPHIAYYHLASYIEFSTNYFGFNVKMLISFILLNLGW